MKGNNGGLVLGGIWLMPLQVLCYGTAVLVLLGLGQPII